MEIKNIGDIFKAQKATDEVIHQNKGLYTGDTFEKRILALIVELGETANEWRAFKFWSEDRRPRYAEKNCDNCNGKGFTLMDNELGREYDDCEECGNPLLEEYVDSLHFLVSIGLDLNVEQVEYRVIENDKDITRQFIELTNMASLLILEGKKHQMWHNLFSAFIRLGGDLGFTWDEIYNAYFDKNKVNHQRQEEGY